MAAGVGSQATTSTAILLFWQTTNCLSSYRSVPFIYLFNLFFLVRRTYVYALQRKRTRHSPSLSPTSATSPTSLYSSRQSSPFSRDDYCPTPMVPLLHALSLLQNAVRSNRIAHFQPSVACIISCVRSVLTAVGCLSRDALLLQQFPSLAQERKHVLSELAAIVNQAKAASDEGLTEDERDMQVEKMVRLGGQVFSRLRRFLAVAVRCGVKVPDKRVSIEYPPMLLESLSTQAQEGFSSRASLVSSSTGESGDETPSVTLRQTKNPVSLPPEPEVETTSLPLGQLLGRKVWGTYVTVAEHRWNPTHILPSTPPSLRICAPSPLQNHG
jgi:hypothetical protein